MKFLKKMLNNFVIHNRYEGILPPIPDGAIDSAYPTLESRINVKASEGTHYRKGIYR